MTFLLDKKSSQYVDQTAVTKYDIPLAVLMENAGRGVADVIVEQYEKYGDKKQDITFVLGVGNNGADGLVAARHLAEQNYNFKIYCCNDLSHASELFLKQKNILEKLHINICHIGDVIPQTFAVQLAQSAIVVDGKVIRNELIALGL